MGRVTKISIFVAYGYIASYLYFLNQKDVLETPIFWVFAFVSIFGPIAGYFCCVLLFMIYKEMYSKEYFQYSINAILYLSPIVAVFLIPASIYLIGFDSIGVISFYPLSMILIILFGYTFDKHKAQKVT